MRVKIRSLTKQLSRLYPASKLFSFVLKGLESKNSRTRAECLDELAYLIQRNGLGVCVPGKVFPVISAQVSDRDAPVRNAALGVIVQAYLLVGDSVFKYLGRISDKDKSLIDERIKRLPSDGFKGATESISVKEDVGKPESVLGLKKSASSKSMPGSPLRNVRKEFSLDLESLELAQSLKGPIKNNDGEVTGLESFRASPWYAVLDEINALDPVGSILALKKLEDHLTKDPSSLLNNVNDLTSSLTTHMHLVFTSADIYTANGSRLGKHLLNALILIFSAPKLPRALVKVSLFQCVQEVLLRLLDPALATVDQGAHLSKMMNILMVRALQNSNSNFSFGYVLCVFNGIAFFWIFWENRPRRCCDFKTRNWTFNRNIRNWS